MPIKHLIASPRLTRDEFERIQAVFLTLDSTKDGQAILAKLGFKGFAPGSAQQMAELAAWLGI